MTGKMRMRPFRLSSRSGSAKEKDCEAIPRLIMNQKWDAVVDMMSKDHSQHVVEFVRNHSTSRKNAGEESTEPVETILHLAVRFHPPLNAIQFVFEAYPRAAFEVDRMGRLPLHLAAKAGASPIVIRFLLLKNPAGGSHVDVTGKTPLHLACENYVLTYDPKAEGSNAQSAEDAIISVVKDLCKSPGCVNVEDMDGMSALEYAIDSDCPLKAVKRLQKSSEKQWKASQDDVETSSDDAKLGIADLVVTERKPMCGKGESRKQIFGSRQKKKRRNRTLAATSA